jgi:GNAT superfamily N-acetyltransferase
MMADVEIREIVADDYPQWLALWAAYNAFYGRVGATALPMDVVAVTWSRFFDPSEPVHALVAEQHGTLLGLAHYLFHRSTIQITPSCYLQDLYTSPDARGKGVGRGLIHAIYDRARAAGLPRVYWQTQQGNERARDLYDKIADRTEFIVYRKLL